MLRRTTTFLLIFLWMISLHAQVPEETLSSNFQIEQPSAKQIQRLFKLCKVWGFLKYKHPLITGGDMDWDQELFDYLRLIDQENFEERLYEKLPALTSTYPITASKNYKWLNDEGFSLKELRIYLQMLSQVRTPQTQAYLEPGQWDISPKFKEQSYPNVDFKDDGVKLLSLFRYWNIIEYFFPYKSLMDEDWDQVLSEYIPKVLDTDTELAYKLVLLELVCEIQDGHGGIHNDKDLEAYLGENQIPIEAKLFGDKLYVVRLFEEIQATTPLKIGDEIIEIEGVSIANLINQTENYIVASTPAAQQRILAEFLLRTSKEYVAVEVERNGQFFTLNIPTQPYNTIRYVQRKIPAHRVLSPEIAYIYPGSLQEGELDSLLRLYKEKASIIFDYRSYPSANIQQILPDFLLPSPQFAFKSTRYSREELGDFTFTKPYPWGQVNEDYFKGNFVILVNEYTQSQPEFEILIYTQAPQVTIIGSATAGTVGNWTPIRLPGNILTSISGNGIFHYDESPVQRVGIIPDIYVERTLEGIKAGKDEILQKAIEFCEK